MQSHPEVFCVDTSPLPKPAVTFARKAQHLLKQYDDMTMNEDVSKIKSNKTCMYRQYEGKRVKHLKQRLACSIEEYEVGNISIESTDNLLHEVKQITLKAGDLYNETVEGCAENGTEEVYLWHTECLQTDT